MVPCCTSGRNCNEMEMLRGKLETPTGSTEEPGSFLALKLGEIRVSVELFIPEGNSRLSVPFLSPFFPENSANFGEARPVIMVPG